MYHAIFDIETTGLDAKVDRLRAFGALSPESGLMWMFTSAGSALDDSERRLIRDLLVVLGEASSWSGWNISEFDLPFIRERASQYDIDFPLLPLLDNKGKPRLGKYGHPRYSSPDKPTRDVAYDYEEAIIQAKAEWKLQAWAKHWGWKPLISLTGADMPDAPSAQVAVHCIDDLEAIAFLLRRAHIGEGGRESK